MTARFEQGLAEVQLYRGDYDAAILAADKALAHDTTYTPPHVLHAIAYSQKGMFAKAEESLARCIPRACRDFGVPLLGYVHAVAGRRSEALRIADSLIAQWNAGRRTDGLASGIAGVYAGLGDRTRALEWLERESDVGVYSTYIGIDPFLRSLHHEPRFRALLKKLRLPPPP
jgi:tetratricopeptide (TPR) repeat protein